MAIESWTIYGSIGSEHWDANGVSEYRSAAPAIEDAARIQGWYEDNKPDEVPVMTVVQA